MSKQRNRQRGADAIELEIYKHLFAATAEEMGTRLMRSAYSPNIKERRDFSCALFDGRGVLLAQAAHIPVHLGAMPMSVQAVLGVIPPARMRDAEVYVHNDPYAGGTHLPDITVVSPVILPGEDRPRFLVANRAHHADIGGITAGSMPLSRSIDEEGLRIGARLLDSACIDWICGATRTPDERRGDLQAQVAAIEVGRERLRDLCARHGAEVVSRRGAELQDYTARIIAGVIEGLPDGEYRFTDYLEDDGFGNKDLAITCRLAVSGPRAELDFTGSADQTAGPVNAVRAITVSAVAYVFRCLAPADIPSNGGVMRSIDVLTRPGSIVDAAEPAPVAAGNVETSQRIVDTVLGALAKAKPDIIPAASCGSMNNLTIGGFDPRFNENFAYYETIGGGAGAGPLRNGASGVHTHMTNTLNTPVEAVEHAYPLLVEAYRLQNGSGGKGRHRGGDGIIRSYLFEQDAEVTLLTERRVRQPYGLDGGEHGAQGRNRLTGTDGQEKSLPGKAREQVRRGERLEVSTPGGGGWGRPAGAN